MTRPADDLAPEEVETVGSTGVPRRIYAYTLPGKEGLIKVGETTKSSVEERIKQQLGTAYPNLEGVSILLDEPAKRADGTWFRDHDVHRALVHHGVKKKQEWFETTLDDVKAAIVAVRNGTTFDSDRTFDFGMRPEQEHAVAVTAGYFTAHAGGQVAEVPLERQDALRQDVHYVPVGPRDGLVARASADLQASRPGRVEGRPAHPRRLRRLEVRGPGHPVRRAGCRR